ncbi:MAG: toprim domain-containing protein [Limisphaerales bacterium]
MNPLERARAYLACVPGAVSGAGGHKTTFYAACLLVQGFNLTTAEALPLLLDWNASCQPPWSEADLRHKLADADKSASTKPSGYLLGSNDGWTSPRPAKRFTPSRIEATHACADEDAAKAAQRCNWPRFESPHEHEHALSALAKLRHVSLEGVKLMAGRSLLFFAGWKDKPAFMVTDGERINAQARRMDGKKWEGIDAKAQTLPGSRAAWPIGARESLPFPVVLLCEGVDILAAHHFIYCHKREADTAAVAILGSSNSIPADALPLFAGKRVRIMAHADEAGRPAAQKWAEQLASVGATVDAADFTGLLMADGSPVKDLNDCTRLEPKQTDELDTLIPNENLQPA